MTTNGIVTIQRLAFIDNKQNPNHKMFALCKSSRRLSSRPTQRQLTYPPCVSHTFSSALLPSGWTLPERPPETFQPGSFSDDRPLCPNIFHSFLSSSRCGDLPCSLHLHVLMSCLLSCSPSGRVELMHRLPVLVTASLRVCVSACVCVGGTRGGVSVDAWTCRMKCRLPPCNASHMQTHTQRWAAVA